MWGSAPPISRGTVEGFVWEVRPDSRTPAQGVTVRLDQGRIAATGTDGRFRFTDLPAGEHRVVIIAERLAVEFDPGPTMEASVVVTPGKAVGVELSVIRMAILSGRVSGPAGLALSGIVIGLSGTERKTNTDAAGNFRFAKLGEIYYTVVLDEKTLPENVVLTTPGSVTLRAGQERSAAEFHLDVRTQERPVPAKPPVSPAIRKPAAEPAQ